jgi:hypothetical protein
MLPRERFQQNQKQQTIGHIKRDRNQFSGEALINRSF